MSAFGGSFGSLAETENVLVVPTTTSAGPTIALATGGSTVAAMVVTVPVPLWT